MQLVKSLHSSVSHSFNQAIQQSIYIDTLRKCSIYFPYYLYGYSLQRIAVCNNVLNRHIVKWMLFRFRSTRDFCEFVALKFVVRKLTLQLGLQLAFLKRFANGER